MSIYNNEIRRSLRLSSLNNKLGTNPDSLLNITNVINKSESPSNDNDIIMADLNETIEKYHQDNIKMTVKLSNRDELLQRRYCSINDLKKEIINLKERIGGLLDDKLSLAMTVVQRNEKIDRRDRRIVSLHQQFRKDIQELKLNYLYEQCVDDIYCDFSSYINEIIILKTKGLSNSKIAQQFFKRHQLLFPLKCGLY